MAAAAIAAVSAIAGATIGPLMQHLITARRERRSLRLQKAEEIYHELRRLTDQLGHIGIDVVSKQIGVDLKTGTGVFDAGLLRILMHVYFPGAEHHFAKYDSQLKKFSEPIAEGLTELGRGGVPQNASEIGQTAKAGLYVASRELLCDLDAFLDKQVKELL